MKKMLLGIALALVGALALPMAAFAADYNSNHTYQADKAGWAEGASPNGASVAMEVWQAADGNYYVATASVEGPNKIDSAFRSEIENAIQQGDYAGADYITGNHALVVEVDGQTVFNVTPKEATGKNQSDAWLVLVIAEDKIDDYRQSDGSYILPVVSAGGFALGTVTMDPSVVPDGSTPTPDPEPGPEPDPEPVKYAYTLKYDLNGGTGAIADQTEESTETSVTFTVSGSTPVRDEYDFLGWATTATATEPDVAGTLNVTSTGESTTVTIYAVWEASQTPGGDPDPDDPDGSDPDPDDPDGSDPDDPDGSGDPDPDPDPDPAPVVPETGDSTALFLVALGAMMALAGALVARRQF